MFLFVVRIAVVALVLMAVYPARADFAAGQRAWDAGNVGEALSQWQSAADEGDRQAMLALGRRYLEGLGVLQDYVEAHKWLNLAASRGEVAALEARDALATKMTPAQIATAQERAAAWRPGRQSADDAPDISTAADTSSPAPTSSPDARQPPPQAIREAQTLLTALGYQPGPADGIWRQRTGEAYGVFLRDVGLPRTEALTPQALRAMRAIAVSRGDAPPHAAEADTSSPALTAEADTSSPAPTSSPDARRPPPQATREAQTLLTALGYRPGPVDGIWGRRTGTAYWAFLRDAGLPRTETLTPQTLRAMQAAAKGKSDAAQTGSGTTAASKTVRASAPPEASGDPPASIQADALHLAAQAGDLEILKAILAAGVDVNARDSQGWTALMHAVNEGYPLLVEPLLAAGTDVDAQAPDGTTALFIAARHGSEIFSELLEKGADISIPGPNGKLPLEVAQDLKHQHIMALPKVVALLATTDTFRAGDTFRECGVCPEMVVVPAGSFMMGSPKDSDVVYSDEMPQHRVTISRPFAVGKHEVTRGQFAAFVAATGYDTGDNWRNPGFEQSDAHPKVHVSWDDAKAYIRWLSSQTGQQYRLLSEAEWEYAARAGTSTRYHFGNTISLSQANYDRNSGGTVVVGSYAANNFGLHDMHGNVWEWVEDCWHNDYTGAPADGSAWVSYCDDYSRVLRGGSWFIEPWFLRSANRVRKSYARVRVNDDGFRVARTLKP